MLAILSLLPSALTAVPVIPTAHSPFKDRQAPFEVTEQAPWNPGAVTNFRIHSSCNASERHQLERGLSEAIELAQHAKDHINRWGNESEAYQKYFGNRPAIEAIGSRNIMVNGDKGRALFGCDDADRDCALMSSRNVNYQRERNVMLALFAAWGGYWRRDNATDETVICPTSFAERRWLATLCGMGYNGREYSRLIYWASDLMHRFYHIPAFGQGYIDDYTEGYEEIVGNTTFNSVNSTNDSDGLQYFALEVYAHDIIAPGEGCPGPTGELPATSSVATAATSVPSSTVSGTATAAPVESPAT